MAPPIKPGSAGNDPKPYTGPERRRHPRLTLDAPETNAGAPSPHHERRQADRRKNTPQQDGAWQGEGPPHDRRSGEDRRQNARRAVDDVRARASWTTGPEHKGGPFAALFGGPRIGHPLLRPSRLALLLVAILSGGIAASLATGTRPQPAPPEARTIVQVEPEPSAQILVARNEIGIGQRLTDTDLSWQDWPRNALRPEYMTRAASPNAMEQLKGTIARFGFFPGEPIRQEKLATSRQGYLSAVLESGKRGVSVTVSAQAASGGFILPNDHVDVVATRTGDINPRSNTILHNVRVLAIDSRLGETAAPAGPGLPGPTGSMEPGQPETFTNQAIATLELDPTQAEMIISAAAHGQLSLILLSATDFNGSSKSTSSANDAIRLTSPFWQN